MIARVGTQVLPLLLAPFIFQLSGHLPFAGHLGYKFRVCFYLKGYPANKKFQNLILFARGGKYE
jgi:hypothetical protein